MKTRYIQVIGDKAKPLPDRLQDQSTHSLELSDEDYDRCVNPTHFKVVDGEPEVLTVAEHDVLILEKKNESHDKSLQSICEKYQADPQGGDCNSNFFGLLMASKAVAKSAGVDLTPKAKACVDWLDALWLDYYSRKGDHTTGQDFSSHGSIPHSFAEVRAEVE